MKGMELSQNIFIIVSFMLKYRFQSQVLHLTAYRIGMDCTWQGVIEGLASLLRLVRPESCRKSEPSIASSSDHNSSSFKPRKLDRTPIPVCEWILILMTARNAATVTWSAVALLNIILINGAKQGKQNKEQTKQTIWKSVILVKNAVCQW